MTAWPGLQRVRILHDPLRYIASNGNDGDVKVYRFLSDVLLELKSEVET